MHIPSDVAFTIGFFVTAVYGTIYNSSRYGLLIALIFALAKEVSDQLYYENYEWVTTVCMMCGAAVAYMILNVFAVL